VSGVDAAALAMVRLGRSLAAQLAPGPCRTTITDGAKAATAWAAAGPTLVRDLDAGAPPATVSADARAWILALVDNTKTSDTDGLNACRP